MGGVSGFLKIQKFANIYKYLYIQYLQILISYLGDISLAWVHPSIYSKHLLLQCKGGIFNYCRNSVAL